VADIPGWDAKNKPQRTLLMRFLLAIGKQQQLAHVWLVTSKDDIQNWVTAGGEAANSCQHGVNMACRADLGCSSASEPQFHGG
jgi:hypothetical protein